MNKLKVGNYVIDLRSMWIGEVGIITKIYKPKYKYDFKVKWIKLIYERKDIQVKYHLDDIDTTVKIMTPDEYLVWCI